MRIALLAMMEPAETGQRFQRAFLRVAGASIAQHQLGLVLAMGCQRVICHARGSSPEIIALQHAAEGAGLQFHIATSPEQIANLVGPGDELIVPAEGLFVEPDKAVPLLEGKAPVVLVQPVEGALAAGYERIDLNRAGAGLMKLPGQVAERLHELPADCDVVSALMRIALQSGIAMREVPSLARLGPAWRMVRSEAEAYEAENEWLRARVEATTGGSPGRWVARMGVLSFGSSLLHAGNASNALFVAVLGSLAIAAGLAWFSLPWAGFVVTAMAWIFVEAAGMLRSAERQAMGELAPPIARVDVLRWLVDTVLGLILLSDLPRFLDEPVFAWLQGPVLLMLLLAVVQRVVAGTTARWIDDRAVLAFVLALASIFGLALHAVVAATIGLAVAALVLPLRRES